MNIGRLISELFEDAIEAPENRNASGNLNWDFVCADVFMSLRDYGVDTWLYSEQIQQQLDKLIDIQLEFCE